MMQDILIRTDESGIYDIEIEGADFKSSEGFETSIPTSLFTDARVGPQVVQNALDRRGWVGNILFVDIQRQLGSTLWTLEQSRLTEDTLNQARVAAQESLQWMIDDGIVLSISVETRQLSDRSIEIAITFRDVDNVIKRYIATWRATNAAALSTI